MSDRDWFGLFGLLILSGIYRELMAIREMTERHYGLEERRGPAWMSTAALVAFVLVMIFKGV